MPSDNRANKSHKHLRITVVGDGTTGKTCLLICYKDKKFQSYYIPTVFDSYSMTVPIGEESYTIILSDTAGQEEYDRLRPLSYPDTDVFIICFAVDNRASMKNVERKWIPEIRHHKPHSKIILVCTKYDLASLETIQRHEGEALQRKYKLDGFVECSSKEMYNINKVFADAISTHLVLPKKQKKSKPMCILL